MHRATPLAREAALSALAAASLAAALAWLGPPGGDLAAHAYQRALFLEEGFSLWNNFWYAGRYSFVTYSVLYYPLAALLGIRLLAVATVATAALAFAVVVGRAWGPTARWSSRTFAVVWAGIVLSAAFPFALGAALGLLALWSLQARARWRFAVLAVLTLAASPLAFLLLVLVVAGIALAGRHDWPPFLAPGLTVVAAGVVEVLLFRAFPDGGHYPFSFPELAAAVVFCLLGVALTWRVERARVLSFIFLVYLAACLGAYLVPSSVGENVARLRFAAIPIAVLALSLREWRPRVVALAALGLAVSWNTSPLAVNFVKGTQDATRHEEYWSPALRYLRAHLTPSYRVEAVDTIGHWPAAHLARAGIPLARGWFRQNDFPQNDLLYSPLGARAYRAWLRRLGIRYVVLTNAPTDYSARSEAALLRSGRSGLRVVWSRANATIFVVPSPRPILTGPAPAKVLALRQTHVSLKLPRPGRYRLAIRWSPYWRPSRGCLSKRKDGMIRVTSKRAGRVELSFDVDAGRALATVAGKDGPTCARRAVRVPGAFNQRWHRAD
ncbi:MAG: hypothetical protein M3M94_04185 [Actinomycetota bacterium]|nr:hypothetical protein [Actinomycetota bacterium]